MGNSDTLRAADGPSPISSAARTVRELMLRSEDADD
jgi:hypothetical protein